MPEKIRERFPKRLLNSSNRRVSLEPKTSTVDDCSSNDFQTEPARVSLPNLPIDIFLLITKYLSFSDLISLSLITKSLRHICPTPKTHALESDTEAEARCFSRIHLRFLPPTPPPLVPEQSIQNSVFSRIYPQKCPYCSHPLCSPSCSSALFLDSSTGIFFPRSLYNITKAIFKYSPGYISTYPNTPATYKLLSMEGGYHLSPSSEPFVYSTIWCAHHRCPRTLLVPDSKSNRPTPGAKLFLEEYMQQWGELRFLMRVKSPHSKVRWSTWAQDLVGYELTMRPIRGGAEYGKRPVYEYAFYETMCRHCRLVCKDVGLASTVFETVWKCGGHTTDVGLGGCRRCGLVSVRFEVVEVFGGSDGRKLAVATEWKEGSRRRLEPIEPEIRAKQLEIVRGRKLIEVVEKGGVGILDLPDGVLRRIMEFVALQSEESEGQPYEMLIACYWFARVWYGQDFYGCCRQFELLEAIMNEKLGRGKEQNSRNR